MANKIIKLKLIIISNCLFFAVILINSFIYLFYDFMNNDVEPSVRIYGKTQVVILLIVILTMVIGFTIKNKSFKTLINSLYYLSAALLLFIQLVPAFLWFVFNGQTVAEPPSSLGVMGSWVYGMYHILIIAWGIFNAWSLHNIRQTE